MCAFEDTSNKSLIRGSWDLALLTCWRARLGRNLTYLGLPGPAILDLLSWKDLLDRLRTGVESVGHGPKQRLAGERAASAMMFNIHAEGLASGFQLLRGDVEDIIIQGVDAYGSPPQMSDGRAPHVSRFEYDVINLDFDGGLGYTTGRGDAKRLEALKKLFERQQGHDFVLLLTVNVRSTVGDDIEQYLQGLRARDQGKGWQEEIDWYLARPSGQAEYKLKATVPSFIQGASELRMFSATCYPPVTYLGHERAKMIHYAFEMRSQTGNLRAFSEQTERSMLDLPLLRSADGMLSVDSAGPGRLGGGNLRVGVDWLPSEMRRLITDR